MDVGLIEVQFALAIVRDSSWHGAYPVPMAWLRSYAAQAVHRWTLERLAHGLPVSVALLATALPHLAPVLLDEGDVRIEFWEPGVAALWRKLRDRYHRSQLMLLSETAQAYASDGTRDPRDSAQRLLAVLETIR